MRAIAFTFLTGFTFLAIGSARADDLTTANAAFDKMDYAKALELYEPLARTGSASAQSAIGSMYFFGNGVVKNWSRAYMWFSLASRSQTAVAVVARTNRDIVVRLMAPQDVKLADAMADECVATHYDHCGLVRYAAR